jgi:hypothetical protein
MVRAYLGNLFLSGLLLAVSLVSSACADPEPLPSNRKIFIKVANDAGVKYDLDGAAYGGPANSYYIKADGGGLNALHISTDPAILAGQATAITSTDTSPTGTFYLTSTGGSGSNDDVILMLSVKGPIADDFSVNIVSGGYSFAPGQPASGTRVEGALNETFTKADFIYGPQLYKPGPGILGTWLLPLYPGQATADASTGQYLMFIDLKAGILSKVPNSTDPGAVKVDYRFNHLNTEAAFNVYAWSLASNQGQGISWTNDTVGAGTSGISGYTVQYAAPPVDNAPPSVTAFSVPATSNGPTVAVTGLSATDNAAVTGYLITESATVPAAAAEGWSAAPPASYIVAGAGDHTLYAFARDAAGNVSAPLSAQVNVAFTLTAQVAGTGSGTVHSAPVGISCAGGSTAGCSASFASASVGLSAAPSAGSLFDGWSGGCSGTGSCLVTMSRDQTVTATFAAAPLVKIGATSYPTLQDAYDHADNGAVIQMKEGVCSGSLTADRAVVVTVKGGYDAGYGSAAGETVIDGKILLRGAAVRCERVKLR